MHFIFGFAQLSHLLVGPTLFVGFQHCQTVEPKGLFPIRTVSMDPYLVLHLPPACIRLYVLFISFQDSEHGSISGATPAASLYKALCLVYFPRTVSMDPYLVLHLPPACIRLYVWFISHQDGEHGSISGATPVASLYNTLCLVYSISTMSMDPCLVPHLPACIMLYVWFLPSVR